MKYIKLFRENEERIHGSYINCEDMDDIQEDLYSKACELANNRGIRISNNKELIYVYFVSFNRFKEVIGALFRGADNEHYSFDIVVGADYENKGLATKLIKIAIEDFKMYKEGNENLIMQIDCINPIMSDILERKFGFKETGRFIHGRRIMSKANF